MSSSKVLDSSFSPTPYWWEAYRPTSGDLVDVPVRARVAIIGGGYAGLSCALELARQNIEAVVLEAEAPGIGASTRSGGAVSGGFHVGKTAKKKGLSDAKRIASLKTSARAAFDCLDDLIKREDIQCSWEKRGRFVGAWTKEDHQAQARGVADLVRNGEQGFRLIDSAQQRQEVASDFYRGGIVAELSGKLHPSLYYQGLLNAALRAGVRICANAAVTRISRHNGGWRLTTKRGEIEVAEVVVATNGHTGAVTSSLRRRLIPICSHVLATEPLPAGLAASLIPNGRSIAETQRVLCYYRMSPDGTRLIFGGRARFTPVGPESIAAILHRFMASRFPQLSDVKVTHAWSGNIAMTFDGLPHTGVDEGMHYALGCNGSGIAMMTYLGKRVAQRIAGTADAECGFESTEFPSFPFYTGNPSMVLPFIGSYYRLRDKISRSLSA